MPGRKVYDATSMKNEHPVGRDQERANSVALHRRKYLPEIVWSSRVQHGQSYSQSLCGTPRRFDPALIAGIGRIPEERHAWDSRRNLLEEFQLFPHEGVTITES